MIDDSILWSVEENEENFGFCYDLNTGKKLSTIASRGRAANELTELEDFQIIGDSVQLYAYPNMIKTFGKRDIIDNVPMGERKFTVTIVPDSIWVRRMVKLPNGFVLATLMPAFSESEKVESPCRLLQRAAHYQNAGAPGRPLCGEASKAGQKDAGIYRGGNAAEGVERSA